MSKALLDAVKTNKNPSVRVQARPGQVVNNDGGFVFTVDDKSRLERFLILGTDGSTYYVGEKDLTKQNIEFLRKMIQTNERLVVDTAVDVSVNGRAYRNSPALFALALVLSEGKDKAYARDAFDKIVRTSTHLFEVAEYIDNLGGWGRAKRAAFAGWYENKSADNLAYQAVKYRQRNGWTHKDVLRLSHAKPDAGVAQFMLGKGELNNETEIIRGFMQMQRQVDVKGVLFTLDQFKNLPWETIPTQFLKDAEVWKKLFHNGQLKGQALVRNIVRLSRIGAFKDMVFAREYADALVDEEMIARSKLHPINFLNASVVYSEGQYDRQQYGRYSYSGTRRKDWETNSVIRDALTAGFHAAFKSVEPAGKRTLIAVDVSPSMSSAAANGLDLTAAQVAGAVGLTVAKTEPYHQIHGFNTSFRDLGVSAGDSIDTAVRKVQNNAGWGGTDVSLPMRWAREHKVEVDTFVVITDNETNSGAHPFKEVEKYRQVMGRDARLAVLGVSATDFTVANPNDRGMMDFVGFDSNAPRVLADFSAGRL